MSAAETLLGAGFDRLFRQARQRLEREPDALAMAKTRLVNPSPEERDHIGGLLGQHFSGKALTVSLHHLDERLLAATGQGLRAWLERAGGPLRDRPLEAAQRERKLDETFHRLLAGPLAAEGWYVRWLERLKRGRVTRLLTMDSLADLDRATAVLEALPAASTAMPVFASRHAGGTKALSQTPLEGLVLGALALRVNTEPPTTTLARRELWAQFGVALDDLTSTVLLLNVRATGTGLVDDLLNASTAIGMPVRLTLHQLVQATPTLVPEMPVFVCENPAIVRMAAERLGAGSAALVATEGQPSVAFWRLMALCGDRVWARADFDQDGLRIGGAVIRRLGAIPWRFDAESYLAAVAENVVQPVVLPETPWDLRLGEVMSGRARVEEEEMLGVLLADLGGGGG